MNCARCRELLSDHLDGRLSPEDERAFQEALTQCPECREELAELKEIQADLRALPIPAPPADLGDRLRRAVEIEASGEDEDAEEPGLLIQLGRWRIAAAVLAIGFGAWALTQGENKGATSSPAARPAPNATSVAEAEAPSTFDDLDIQIGPVVGSAQADDQPELDRESGLPPTEEGLVPPSAQKGSPKQGKPQKGSGTLVDAGSVALLSHELSVLKSALGDGDKVGPDGVQVREFAKGIEPVDKPMGGLTDSVRARGSVQEKASPEHERGVKDGAALRKRAKKRARLAEKGPGARVSSQTVTLGDPPRLEVGRTYLLRRVKKEELRGFLKGKAASDIVMKPVLERDGKGVLGQVIECELPRARAASLMKALRAQSQAEAILVARDFRAAPALSSAVPSRPKAPVADPKAPSRSSGTKEGEGVPVPPKRPNEAPAPETAEFQARREAGSSPSIRLRFVLPRAR